MTDITTTVGILALVGVVLAALAIALAARLWIVTRRLRSAQRVVLGEHGRDDLVAHGARLAGEFAALHSYVEDVAERLERRMVTAEQRLDGAIAHRALVRYDAYNEMSGRQSASIALLDSSRTGLVLSSIHHRDTARLYVKAVRAGVGETELSPEEDEAVRLAMNGEAPAESPGAAR